MKITITELKEIIREEILAEKQRRRKKSREVYKPIYSYPYHISPNYISDDDMISDDFGELGYPDIEIS